MALSAYLAIVAIPALADDGASDGSLQAVTATAGSEQQSKAMQKTDSDADARAKAKADAYAAAKAKAEADAEAKAAAAARAKAKADADAAAKAKAEADAEAKARADAHAAAKAKAEADAEAKAAAAARAKAKVDADAKARADADAIAKADEEAESESKAEAKAKAESEPETTAEPEAKAGPNSKDGPKPNQRASAPPAADEQPGATPENAGPSGQPGQGNLTAPGQVRHNVSPSASPRAAAQPSAEPTPAIQPKATRSAEPTEPASQASQPDSSPAAQGEANDAPPVSPVVTCDVQPVVSDGSQDIVLHMTQVGGGNGTKNWFQVTAPGGAMILDVKQDGPATEHGEYTYTLPASLLTGAGLYQVACIAWHDNSIRIGEGSTAFLITPDTTAPSITPGDLTTAPMCATGSLTITGTFSDAHPASYSIVVRDAANAIVGQAIDASPPPGATTLSVTIDLAPLADGPYTVAFDASDQAGNTAHETRTFTVDNSPCTYPSAEDLTASAVCDVTTNTVVVNVEVANETAPFTGTLTLPGSLGSDGPKAVAAGSSTQFRVDTGGTVVQAGSATLAMSRTSPASSTSVAIPYPAATCNVGGPRPVLVDPPVLASPADCDTPYAVVTIPSLASAEVSVMSVIGVARFVDQDGTTLNGVLHLPVGESITITAIPLEGYVITNGPWTLTAEAPTCPQPTETATPTPSPTPTLPQTTQRPTPSPTPSQPQVTESPTPSASPSSTRGPTPTPSASPTPSVAPIATVAPSPPTDPDESGSSNSGGSGGQVGASIVVVPAGLASAGDPTSVIAPEPAKLTADPALATTTDLSSTGADPWPVTLLAVLTFGIGIVSLLLRRKGQAVALDR